MPWSHVVAVGALALGTAGAQDRASPPAAAPVRVLYLEDTPRWEYRYLKNGLLRSDPGVTVQTFLFDASDDFPQESSAGLPSLDGPPRTREELAAYDVVLIGDVPPERIDPLAGPREAWMKLLVEFVEAGGAVGFLAGERATPNAWRGTPLEKLLPVELEPKRAEDEPRRVSGGFVPELVQADHEITMLHADPRLNAKLWREGLPPLMAYYPVARAAEGADVILAHPTDRNDDGAQVIAATAEVGNGRTFYMGTDETWRWRKPYGDKLQDRFWINVVEYLAQRR